MAKKAKQPAAGEVRAIPRGTATTRKGVAVSRGKKAPQLQPKIPFERVPILDPATLVALTPGTHRSRGRQVLAFDAAGVGPTPVPNPTSIPWQSICRLDIITSNNRHAIGTGWLLANDLIVTAGHCVFLRPGPGDAYAPGWIRSVQITPGSDLGQPVPPFGSLRIEDRNCFKAPSEWVEDGSSEADFAAIKLPAGQQFFAGILSARAANNAELQSSELLVAGYPGDPSVQIGRMYQSSGHLLQPTDWQLFFDNATYIGQSGSPLFATIGGQLRVVGIHNIGIGTANVATRINPSVAQWLLSWVG